ncbi:MAG: peptidoglycan editing factor PgeF [Pseudomonadota bacterium]|jgi:polyphenol oxidase
MKPHPDWIAPDWPAPAHVRAVFTTRAGGVSSAPFDSLNLGDHVHDRPESVSANRKIVHDMLGAHPVYLQQVHGTGVLTIDASTPDGVVADAAVTANTGVACTVMVADCLPVLFTDSEGRVVAAAHAGWRGLEQGVLESAVSNFSECFSTVAPVRYASPAIHSIAPAMLAWLGPCIGPQAFEVGPEVRDAFVSHDVAAQALFLPGEGGKWLADLAGLARQRLQAMGMTRIYGNDSSAAWCTVSNRSRLFSHRRDTVNLGGSGRMVACIWRV